ncbi:MAG: transglutaminase-like domain-containing protein, partial [Rubrobacteraceae bacterium]
SETAQRIQTRYNTDNPYSTARAIEQYLRLDGGFTYNLDADFRRADRALEKFLAEDGEREGFCTQFATSMALIARDLDIPSRVVYGSTQGEPGDPGEYIVRGRNMHTWVELYFPGIGWYSFDPTPGFSLPNAMQANAPPPQTPIAQDDLRMQGPAAFGGQDPADQPVEDKEPRESEDPTTSNRNQMPELWPFLIPIPILLLATPLAKRALLVRRRPEDLYRDLTGRLRDVLEPGRGSIADSPALTPTERLILLSGAAGLREDSFRDFARAYSDHLYSPDPSPDVGHAYRDALRELQRLPRWRRILGAINPASLGARTKVGIASAGKRVHKALAGSVQKLRRRKRR